MADKVKIEGVTKSGVSRRQFMGTTAKAVAAGAGGGGVSYISTREEPLWGPGGGVWHINDI